MKKLLILFSIILQTSCQSIKEYNKTIPIPESPITIQVHQMHNMPIDVEGYYRKSGNICHIYLRRYPRCLAHEVRHCLEGAWHGNKPNYDDCT
jgi:hypothetical protein